MNRVVEFALRQRMLVVALLALLLAGGTFAFINLNIEAYPDPVPPLVDIITQSNGMSAEEIERYITIPIEVQMAGIPHVTSIRTISLFGLSDVKLQFSYDFTYDEAQQWVINRLSQLPQLPNGVQPQISPWSPVGCSRSPGRTAERWRWRGRSRQWARTAMPCSCSRIPSGSPIPSRSVCSRRWPS